MTDKTKEALAVEPLGAEELRIYGMLLEPTACSDECGQAYYGDGDKRIWHECCSTVAAHVEKQRQRIDTLEAENERLREENCSCQARRAEAADKERDELRKRNEWFAHVMAGSKKEKLTELAKERDELRAEVGEGKTNDK